MSEISITFKPINTCNQNCVYCFDKPNHKDVALIDKERIYAFADKIFREFSKISWTWHGGEPLLCGKEWFEDVMFNLNKMREFYRKDIDFSIQTNATLLDDEWLMLLKRYNIDIGSSYDLSDKYRGYSYPEEKLDTSSGAIVVLNKDNIDHLVDIYEKFNNKNQALSYNFPYYTNSDFTKKLLGDYDYAIEKYVEFLKYYITNPNGRSIERTSNSWILMAIGNHGNLCSHAKCWRESLITVTSDGTIWKCDNTTFPIFKIGNIDTYTCFEDLEWENLDDMTYDYLECEDCELHDVCGYGCPFDRLQESNFEKPSSFHCKMMKRIIPELFEMLNNLSPEELANISKPVRRLLIKNNYLPSYILEILYKDLIDVDTLLEE